MSLHNMFSTIKYQSIGYALVMRITRRTAYQVRVSQSHLNHNVKDLLLALVPLSAVGPCPRDLRLLTLVVLPLARRKEDCGGGCASVKRTFTAQLLAGVAANSQAGSELVPGTGIERIPLIDSVVVVVVLKVGVDTCRGEPLGSIKSKQQQSFRK